MAGLFKRLFSIGEAEAHSALNKVEDPVKMTEQGIRELKSDLEKAMQAMAEVKSISIRSQRDLEKAKNEAAGFESKAMALLKKAETGNLDKSKAESLAVQILQKKSEIEAGIPALKQTAEQQEKQAGAMQANVKKIQDQIRKYENELVTLKARAKTATATKKLNQQIAQIDSDGTIAMLERMKEKVEEEESLALAYGEMAETSKSLDDQVEEALLTDDTNSANTQLLELKKKMGMS